MVAVCHRDSTRSIVPGAYAAFSAPLTAVNAAFTATIAIPSRTAIRQLWYNPHRVKRVKDKCVGGRPRRRTGMVQPGGEGTDWQQPHAIVGSLTPIQIGQYRLSK